MTHVPLTAAAMTNIIGAQLDPYFDHIEVGDDNRLTLEWCANKIIAANGEAPPRWYRAQVFIETVTDISGEVEADVTYHENGDDA